MSDTKNSSRRGFLQILGAAGALALGAAQEREAWAQGAAAELPHLSPADPTAKALGYVEDASKVDKTKFPTLKPGARCSNCNFYQGAAGKAFGPCQLFPGKSVNAAGWCASHSPKA